jgi:hypothetical protein
MMADLLVAEHKLNDTCSELKTNMSLLVYDFVKAKIKCLNIWLRMNVLANLLKDLSPLFYGFM